MARKFLIDTDTASDDAVALIMALAAKDVDLQAITVVAGNVPLPQAVRNALTTVHLCGADVPVYAGAGRPLIREAVYAHDFHGPDGMGGQGYPEPPLSPRNEHAIDAIIDTVARNPGIVLVTLGPLTNIALALAKAPWLADNVSRCVVMGGAAVAIGNVTPAAEFNVWHDPEAARIVFRSSLPIEVVGWELCRGAAALDGDEIAALRALGTPAAEFAIDCNRSAIAATSRTAGQPALTLPDPVAMAIALEPAICTRSSRHLIEVETASDLTRGMTVVDQLNVARRRRSEAWASAREHTVCWEIDIPRWKQLLRDSLS